MVVAGNPVHNVFGIPREELVPPLAGENDLDVLSRQFGDEVHAQVGGFAHRFVTVPGQDGPVPRQGPKN